MQNFRTDVSISSASPFAHRDKLFTIGSCFAQAIGDRLMRYKFDATVSPFGVIYNPVSIHKSLRYAVHHEPPQKHTYLENHGLHLNYDFHSSLSSVRQEDLEGMIANMIGALHYFLASSARVIITYGTAWVYTRKETGEIVANCHKMPATTFAKSLLSESDIVNSFRELYAAAKKLNPALRFILTLSPVRHLRDTLELNSAGKAVVRAACHKIAEEFADAAYFPAYEIMMDDLRDYRFYKADMIHPTEEAEGYIFEKFAQTYFDDSTRSFICQWDAILAAINHRAFHPGSVAHQQFLRETLKKIEAFAQRFNVDDEIRLVRSQMTGPP